MNWSRKSAAPAASVHATRNGIVSGGWIPAWARCANRNNSSPRGRRSSSRGVRSRRAKSGLMRVSTSTGPGKSLGMRYATATAAPSGSIGLLGVIYLVAGGIVSSTHHHWQNLHALKHMVSAILATLLWPLLLVGINLHIH